MSPLQTFDRYLEDFDVLLAHETDRMAKELCMPLFFDKLELEPETKKSP